MPVTERFTWLSVQDKRRDDNDMRESNYSTMSGVNSRRETGSNQTEEENVLLTVSYFHIVRLN
jgi:hypothetical protein